MFCRCWSGTLGPAAVAQPPEQEGDEQQRDHPSPEHDGQASPEHSGPALDRGELATKRGSHGQQHGGLHEGQGGDEHMWMNTHVDEHMWMNTHG